METKKPSFTELLNESEIPILVDFYADWCGPCRSLAPILKEVAGNMEGKVKIIKIDVDKNQSLSQKYRVQGIPTMIMFHKGQILWRQSGVVPKTQIESAILAHQP